MWCCLFLAGLLRWGRENQIHPCWVDWSFRRGCSSAGKGHPSGRISDQAISINYARNYALANGWAEQREVVAEGHGFYVVVARTRWKTLSRRQGGWLKAASDLNASSTRVKSSVPWFFFLSWLAAASRWWVWRSCLNWAAEAWSALLGAPCQSKKCSSADFALYSKGWFFAAHTSTNRSGVCSACNELKESSHSSPVGTCQKDVWWTG